MNIAFQKEKPWKVERWQRKQYGDTVCRLWSDSAAGQSKEVYSKDFSR